MVVLTLAAVIKAFCKKMAMLKENESIHATFNSDVLRNFTMVLEHLPDVLEMLFENVMSEDVDSYVMKTPPQEVMEKFVKELCYGNGSMLIKHPEGQKAIGMLCDMDWDQFKDEFMKEMVQPYISNSMDKVINAVEAAEHGKCIYESIRHTNWTNIVNVTKYMAIGEPNFDNL